MAVVRKHEWTGAQLSNLLDAIIKDEAASEALLRLRPGTGWRSDPLAAVNHDPQSMLHGDDRIREMEHNEKLRRHYEQKYALQFLQGTKWLEEATAAGWVGRTPRGLTPTDVFGESPVAVKMQELEMEHIRICTRIGEAESPQDLAPHQKQIWKQIKTKGTYGWYFPYHRLFRKYRPSGLPRAAAIPVRGSCASSSATPPRGASSARASPHHQPTTDPAPTGPTGAKPSSARTSASRSTPPARIPSPASSTLPILQALISRATKAGPSRIPASSRTASPDVSAPTSDFTAPRRNPALASRLGGPQIQSPVAVTSTSDSRLTSTHRRTSLESGDIEERPNKRVKTTAAVLPALIRTEWMGESNAGLDSEPPTTIGPVAFPLANRLSRSTHIPDPASSPTRAPETSTTTALQMAGSDTSRPPPSIPPERYQQSTYSPTPPPPPLQVSQRATAGPGTASSPLPLPASSPAPSCPVPVERPRRTLASRITRPPLVVDDLPESDSDDDIVIEEDKSTFITRSLQSRIDANPASSTPAWVPTDPDEMAATLEQLLHPRRVSQEARIRDSLANPPTSNSPGPSRSASGTRANAKSTRLADRLSGRAISRHRRRRTSSSSSHSAGTDDDTSAPDDLLITPGGERTGRHNGISCPGLDNSREGDGFAAIAPGKNVLGFSFGPANMRRKSSTVHALGIEAGGRRRMVEPLVMSGSQDKGMSVSPQVTYRPFVIDDGTLDGLDNDKQASVNETEADASVAEPLEGKGMLIDDNNDEGNHNEDGDVLLAPSYLPEGRQEGKRTTVSQDNVNSGPNSSSGSPMPSDAELPEEDMHLDQFKHTTMDDSSPRYKNKEHLESPSSSVPDRLTINDDPPQPDDDDDDYEMLSNDEDNQEDWAVMLQNMEEPDVLDELMEAMDHVSREVDFEMI